VWFTTAFSRTVFTLSDYIHVPASRFKLDLVLMSIVILCIIAMGLYGLLGWFEKKLNA
jgi:ABC-type nitrate/sulfonate/bicarbonate transport system permease component